MKHWHIFTTLHGLTQEDSSDHQKNPNLVGYLYSFIKMGHQLKF